MLIALVLGAGTFITFRSVGQTDTSTPRPPKLHLVITHRWKVKKTHDFKALLTRIDPRGSKGSKAHFIEDDGTKNDWPPRDKADTAAAESADMGATKNSHRPPSVHVTQTIYTTSAKDLEDIAKQLTEPN